MVDTGDSPDLREVLSEGPACKAEAAANKAEIAAVQCQIAAAIKDGGRNAIIILMQQRG